MTEMGAFFAIKKTATYMASTKNFFFQTPNFNYLDQGLFFPTFGPYQNLLIGTLLGPARSHQIKSTKEEVFRIY